MSYELSRNESILPPGYRLQVIKNAEGFLETVPLGTNSKVWYGGGIQLRERLARELLKLFCEEFGFTPHSREVMVICADIEGNECVWCRARVHPPGKTKKLANGVEVVKKTLRAENSDVIDI